MQRTKLPALAALLIAGCGEEVGGQLYSEAHPALKSPCQATDIPLLLVAKLGCFDLSPSPLAGDPEFFSADHLPKSRRTEALDGSLIDERNYDYDAPFVYPNATYFDDGNIKSVTFPEQFAGQDSPIFEYQYDDGTLISAYATTNGTRSAQTEILYRDGRRDSEGLIDSQKTRWFYRYDGDGRLIAKLGGGTIDRVPEEPSDDVLTMGCADTVPMLAEDPNGDFGFAGGEYYFRKSDGRIETIISGITPGLRYRKYSFVWNGDELTSATLECSDLQDSRPQKSIYTY